MSSIMKGIVDETEAKKGADGKRCWKGKRYAGTENGKDKCIPVKEESDEEALERLKKNKSKEKWMADADLEYMHKRHAKNKPVKNESAYEKDLEDNEPRIVSGVYGAKSKEFRKKFANQRAQDRFFDHPDREGNYEIHYVQKANVSETDEGDKDITQQSYPYLLAKKNYGLGKQRERAKAELERRQALYQKGLHEGVIVGHDKDDPEVAILGGAGTMSLSRLKNKAHGEAMQLVDDIAKGNFKASAYNIKQLANSLNTIATAEEEMSKSYFGEGIEEAREMSPALRAAQKNLIDLSTGEVRRREDAKRAADKREREYAKQAARDAKPKKPTLDQIWQKVEHAISNYFPDGDPTDYLNPYMQKTGIDWDDITRAAKRNGYKDLWDYWNTLAQDIENDAYADWHISGGKNVRQRAPFMEEPSSPVGEQPGGLRTYRPKAAGTFNESSIMKGIKGSK